MSFQLPALPNFTPNTPAAPDLLGQYGKVASLQNMQSEQQLRQSLAPYEVQEAQARASQAQGANQIQQMDIATRKAQNAYWSNPDQFAVADPAAQQGNDKVAQLLGVSSDDPILNMVHGQVKAGVPMPAAINDAKQTLEFRKTLAQTTQEHQKVIDDSLAQTRTIAAPIINEKDPTKKAALIADALPQLQELAKPNPAISQMIGQLNVSNFDAFANRIGAAETAIKLRSDSADAWDKELKNATTADPLLKMETNPSEAFSGDKLPASIAYLKDQAKSNDTQTAVRATKLLGIAKASEAVELGIDAAKKQAAQTIADGDPSAAAKLLVSGVVAPSQIISSRKPEFAQKAFTAAQALDGNWSAQKAEADFKVAGSPENVKFFGSLKSLTDPGGTLDQLKAAGAALPGNQLPVFNSMADIYKSATGSGPIAKYATTLLGVADDYAKVTGGGQGTEGMQKFIMGLVPAKASPEARNASIDGIRDSVLSQGRSRIGNNSVLQRQYGENLPAPGSRNGAAAAVDPFAQFGGVAHKPAGAQ